MIGLLFAQAASSPVFDYTAMVVAAILALTPVFVSILGTIAEKLNSVLPSWTKALIAALLGALVAYLAGLGPASPIVVALVGLASVGLREVISKLGQKFGFIVK